MMGKLLQALSVLVTLAVVASRDWFYLQGYREYYLAAIGMSLAFAIFVMQRGALPLIGIVVMAFAVTSGDDTLAGFRFDQEVVVAAGMLVAGYAWWQGHR